MFIHDIYILGESDSFEIKTREEISVNLELEKVPTCYHTLFTGIVTCTNLPIKNATVVVMDGNYNPVSSTGTDENGVYRFHIFLLEWFLIDHILQVVDLLVC